MKLKAHECHGVDIDANASDFHAYTPKSMSAKHKKQVN